MNVLGIFDKFSQKRILVVGDVMIDSYLRGSVSRVSPEAPVPIINLRKKEDRLGGAANVALNLAALGATPILCTIVGQDYGGDSFNELLYNNDLSIEGIIKSPGRMTTRKTRVIGNNQHLIRIDEEEVVPLTLEEENGLIARIEELIVEGVDAMILEDYNKGLLTPRLIEEIIAIANRFEVIVAVDPKKENFLAYRNVTLFKPNLKELKEGLHYNFDFSDDKEAFEKAVDQLESVINNKISLVTLSEHGVFIKKEGVKTYIPAHIRNIADVSGAGDTVISVATLCLTAGMEIKEIAEMANLAGGLVCEMSGVVPIDKDLLIREALKLIEA